MSDGGERAARVRVLVVDDDEALRDRLARALGARGLEVDSAGDFDGALARARARAPDWAVVDLRMPGRSGLELVAALVAGWPAVRVVVLTGYGSIATAIEAMRRGAFHYLQKPVDVDDLIAAFSPPTTDPIAAGGLSVETPSLARAEWEHIQRVLQAVGGNISEAARRLGLHRRSLQRKLQKYPPRD
jgi:two-component system response regulator RegA